MSLYDITVKDAQGNDTSLSQYKGKTLLVVNTATNCGFTPQYKGLQELYDKYKDQNFEILDFPCNQFANQAPGSDEEIGNFCEMNYHTAFPRFAKVDVNGENESPVFTYLKSQKRGVGGANIKWNFTKFLVDQEGKVVSRFASTTKPESIEKQVAALVKG